MRRRARLAARAAREQEETERYRAQRGRGEALEREASRAARAAPAPAIEMASAQGYLERAASLDSEEGMMEAMEGWRLRIPGSFFRASAGAEAPSRVGTFTQELRHGSGGGWELEVRVQRSGGHSWAARRAHLSIDEALGRAGRNDDAVGRCV